MDVSRRELNRRYLISNYPDKIYRKTKETTIRVLFRQMLTRAFVAQNESL